jgi:hypothetical protein
VVYDHAGSDGRGMMRQVHEEQGNTAVDYTGKEAESSQGMGAGSVSLQSSDPKSAHTQQLVESINKRSTEMGLSINLSDQASQAEINQASETINSVIKYDQQTFGTVLTTEKKSLLNEYLEQQNSDLPQIAYAGDEQKYAPIKPIIEKIDQLQSASNNEAGFIDRLDQNINKSAAFKPLFQSQSTGQPVVDALIATSDAILNLPTTATNLALVTANSPAIVLSVATGDSLEKSEMDILGAAMSVAPQLEGLAQLSTVRRAIGLTTANTASLTASRLSEGGQKVTDFFEKSFVGRLKREGDSPTQTELKVDSGSCQVAGGEGVGARNADSLGADESATMEVSERTLYSSVRSLAGHADNEAGLAGRHYREVEPGKFSSQIELALESNVSGVLLEGKVGKALDQKGLLLDYQSKFRKGFTTDGKPIGIGEIDVETPRFIVELASGRKPGKMDQLSLLQNSTLLNPERKPVILFAPQVDKLQQIKAYENIGVKVINNLDQLFEFGAKKGGL